MRGFLAGFLYLFAFAVSLCSQTDLGLVRPAGQPVRAVVFGDFGYEGSGSGQAAVVKSILAPHGKNAYHLGLTLGDNFYPRGVRSVEDPHWKTNWRNPYDGLGIKFYAALGNHDYMGNEQAQIDYTNHPDNRSWQMPARYYTFGAGPVRFFALDTDEGTSGGLYRLFRKPWSVEQSAWLDAQLEKYSPARWKVVYGHHPIYSDGYHGDSARLIEKLLPLLKKHNVDVYLAGHDHDMQHFERDGMHFFVVGGGGKNTRQITGKRTVFAESMHGFLEMEADDRRLSLRLVGTSGKEHPLVLTK